MLATLYNEGSRIFMVDLSFWSEQSMEASVILYLPTWHAVLIEKYPLYMHNLKCRFSKILDYIVSLILEYNCFDL